jgi:hypothetical protein
MAAVIVNVRDAIGARGEIIFSNLISKFHADRQGPIFRSHFLGDKWPSADFIVELIGARETTPYFFVQVRATRREYIARSNRLRVRASADQVRCLFSYPAPTYIIGIDEVRERGYIVSANGETLNSMPNLSTRCPINKRNRMALWTEVNSFWSRHSGAKLVSRFADPNWR